ncbi:MAG: hypothetical protein U5L98_18290 [Halomonas sp.]|uniref:hypothetical protein n=1 Tax=Halomonas sp. TaxID=1486246 RepID=UPI002ACD3C73|nr:hypothetical protein [Halomonas sp.]MDZ7854523.1 hypothetical protein [Halomonas sp.]
MIDQYPTGPFQTSSHGQDPCLNSEAHLSIPDRAYLLARGIGKAPLSMTGATLINPLYFVDGQISLEYAEVGAGSALNKIPPNGKDDFSTIPLIEKLSASGQVLVGAQCSECVAAHKTTGLPVVIVPNRGNLPPVAQRLRKALPSKVSVATLVEDDSRGYHNPDITSDDFPQSMCRHNATKARGQEQLDRICAIIESIVRQLETLATHPVNHDHRREAKEQ